MLRFDITEQYKGVGFSQGLDRGLLVYSDDKLLLEEGMGLGICALQADGYSFFTTPKSVTKPKEGSFEVIYSIDRILEWGIFGIKSKPLTKALEYLCTNIYMKNERGQNKLLKVGKFFQKLFRVNAFFTKVAPFGEIKARYIVSDNDVSVDLSCEAKINDYKLFVMNELGGNVFNQSIINGKPSPPPSAWQKIEGQCELYSPTHSLAFTIAERHVPDNVKSAHFWGRELSNDLCWAGFDSELKCDSYNVDNYSYSIKFREAVL